MGPRIRSIRTYALSIAGLLVACLLFAWLALPGIIQSTAQNYIAQKTGHHLTMSKPEFNPFKLRLRLSGLHLTEPDGKPLLGFRELELDLSSASLYRRALVFDSIRLDGLEARAELMPHGRMNWSALIDALKSPEQNQASGLPRFDVSRLVVSGTRLDFADHRVKPAYVTRIEPIDLDVTEFSSLPGEAGQYRLSARTHTGARLNWQGAVTLEPLNASGSFAVEDVSLAQFEPYVKESLPISSASGTAGVAAGYRVGYAQGRLDVTLEHVKARLTDVKFRADAGLLVAVTNVEAKGGRFDLGKNSLALDSLTMAGGSLDLQRGTDGRALEIGALSVDDVRVNLNSRHAKVGRVALKNGHVRVARDAKGGIDILDALNPAQQATHDAKTVAPAKAGWHYLVDKLDLAGFDAVFTDGTLTPAAKFAVQDVSLSLSGISENLNAALPIKAAFAATDGGRFEADGTIVPALPKADIGFKLTDLAVKPAQPYLAMFARLKISDGRLSVQGRAGYGPEGANFKGGFALRDLRLDEADTGNLFLAWKSLGSSTVDLSRAGLDIDELALDGLDGKLIINKDKTLSFKRVLVPAAKSAPARPVAGSSSPAFLVNIDRLSFRHGEMDYADNSLALPFGTHILNIRGVIAGLSNRPDALGQIELAGKVDDYGLARAVGQIDLMDPADFMDLTVVFRNIEMSRLTPYSATFAGRKITSGKLSLDLEYKIKQRQLQGNNKIIMDQLTLGERVASPKARDLPLDLAISILQDSDGRIDLGLPVSGSLDDPKFSLSGILWEAFSNVLSRIATAPFRALAALFGGGGDKSDNIVFDAGNARLSPPEREKLAHLAEALNKRPALFVSVSGVYADADRAALQDAQMRRSVALASGQHLADNEDPGPISTRQPRIQAALEKMFADRFGGGELAALKDGFRRANPGQLEEGVAGQVISRLTGLFREKRELDEQEVGSLKGRDFYGVLFERLRSSVAIDDKQLQSLADSRGAAIMVVLKAAGAPVQSFAAKPSEKVEAQGGEVPLKLVFGARAAAPSS